MIHCWLIALVRKLVKFLFALFGFLVNFSEKRAASQKNTQLFKTAFTRCSTCQMPELSTGPFTWGPECGRVETVGADKGPDRGRKRAE
jgi:hypothetical protein